ncbi:MAG TPA: glycosyltransferase family 4 protein [Solirubrobacterales bacterium]|nr:glycosyltransferase family 4 protein [Solirubrobacterales bacterium]
MKVLIATDTVGGVLTYTTELATALEARGHEAVVATMGPPLRPGQRARLPRRVHESECRLEWMADPWDDVAAAGEWLRELEEEERPDAVHLCSYAHGAVEFAAPKVLVAHSCVLSWWRAVHGAEAPPEWDRYREEMAAGLRGADAVVAPSRAMLRELERDHDLRRGRAGVIHNGTPPPTGRKPLAPSGNRPVGGRRGLVLGSGRFWDPAKNLAALDAAAAGLAWPVAVAGDLGEGDPPRHAESLGALSAAELAAFRRRAPIYAAPARYEPFGLGILEAAAEGCALVLGDIPSLRELWGDAAIFVDPRDHRSLHRALATLIARPRLREELGALAESRAGDYSIDLFSQGYERLYTHLIATRAGVRA